MKGNFVIQLWRTYLIPVILIIVLEDDKFCYAIYVHRFIRSVACHVTAFNRQFPA
jgi:hypothetical protein